MKKYFKIAALILVQSLLVTSCVKEYEIPNDGTDCTWYVSGREDSYNYDPIVIVQDDYLGFMDASLNATSHFWDVGTDGTYMLSGSIKGSNVELSDYVDESISHITTNESIMVWFRNEGLHGVRLRNTFDSEVTYESSSTTGMSFPDKYTSTYDEVRNEYVLDTTMMVEVYGKTLVPGARVFRDAALLDEIETGYEEDGTTVAHSVNILFGETLYFVDNSTYKPNVWTWKCEAAGIGVADADDLDDEDAVAAALISGEVVALTFNSLSTAVTGFKVLHTVQRDTELSNIESSYATAASAKSLTVPLNIFVEENIKSVEPTFELLTTDYSVVVVTLPNTTFESDTRYIDYLFGDTSSTVADTESGSESDTESGSDDASATSSGDYLYSLVKAYIGTAEYSCTSAVLDSNELNKLYLTFSTTFKATDDIVLKIDTDIRTSLYTSYSTDPLYSGMTFVIPKDSYTDIQSNLVENMLYGGDYTYANSDQPATSTRPVGTREVADIDYLYKKLCNECGLPHPEDTDYDEYKASMNNISDDEIVAANNKNIDFRVALRKVYVGDMNSDGNSTASIEIVRIEGIDGDIDNNSTYFDESGAKYCLKYTILQSASKLRVGSAYSYDLPGGTYYYKMTIAMPKDPTFTFSGGMYAYICDPYPASYVANDFLGGNAIDYIGMSAYLSGMNGNWITYDQSTVSGETFYSSENGGFDNSMAVSFSYFNVGQSIYLRDFVVSNSK